MYLVFYLLPLEGSSLRAKLLSFKVTILPLYPLHLDIDWCVCVCVCVRVPPGSSVHGILQAKTLEWVAISFSREASWTGDRTQISCIGGNMVESKHWMNEIKAPAAQDQSL